MKGTELKYGDRALSLSIDVHYGDGQGKTDLRQHFSSSCMYKLAP